MIKAHSVRQAPHPDGVGAAAAAAALEPRSLWAGSKGPCSFDVWGLLNGHTARSFASDQ